MVIPLGLPVPNDTEISRFRMIDVTGSSLHDKSCCDTRDLFPNEKLSNYSSTMKKDTSNSSFCRTNTIGITRKAGTTSSSSINTPTNEKAKSSMLTTYKLKRKSEFLHEGNENNNSGVSQTVVDLQRRRLSCVSKTDLNVDGEIDLFFYYRKTIFLLPFGFLQKAVEFNNE